VNALRLSKISAFEIVEIGQGTRQGKQHQTMASRIADIKARADLSVQELKALYRTVIVLTFVFPRHKTISILTDIVADEIRRFGY